MKLMKKSTGDTSNEQRATYLMFELMELRAAFESSNAQLAEISRAYPFYSMTSISAAQVHHTWLVEKMAAVNTELDKYRAIGIVPEEIKTPALRCN